MLCADNKGLNITNYVVLSGVCPIRDVAYVSREIIFIPPSVGISGSKSKSSSSFVVFEQVEGG